MSDAELEVLGDYFVKHRLMSRGWTFESFLDEWKLGFIGADEFHSDARIALIDYKNKGERVDEVLFHIITTELDKLHSIIDQKNRDYDSACKQVTKLLKEAENDKSLSHSNY